VKKKTVPIASGSLGCAQRVQDWKPMVDLNGYGKQGRRNKRRFIDRGDIASKSNQDRSNTDHRHGFSAGDRSLLATMYPLGTISTKNLVSFIRFAISMFASLFLHCLFFRFARFLQQSSHPILVPQPENRQGHKFWWAVPDAPIETLTRFPSRLASSTLDKPSCLRIQSNFLPSIFTMLMR